MFFPSRRLIPRRRWVVVAWLLGWALAVLAACQADDLERWIEPPRLATQTAQAEASAAPPLMLPAPTPTPGGLPLSVTQSAGPGVNAQVTIWIDETSPRHVAAMQQLGADFTAQSGIQVETVFVETARLPELVQTAALSATLPDLILHPMEYTLYWTQQGVLDPQAATTALERLGRETFAPAALTPVTLSDGQTAALPSHGWAQLLLYRQDWFDQAGLPAPTTFEHMLTAAATFYNLEQVITGFVVSTDANVRDTQRIFEQFALANSCQLIDAEGVVQFQHPACLQTLDFYYRIVNQYSPPGYQTEISALKAYLAGRTAIIMAKPTALSALVGLDPDFPPRCPECADPTYLARHTGFLTQVTGAITYGVPAHFSELNYLGITTVADPAPTQAFVDYWFNAGYPAWLGIQPEMSLPLRLGSPTDPLAFETLWRALPLAGSDQTLTAYYGVGLVDQLLASVRRPGRWAFPQGQGALMGAVYSENVLSPILQKMLSGYISTSEAIFETYDGVSRLLSGDATPSGGG